MKEFRTLQSKLADERSDLAFKVDSQVQMETCMAQGTDLVTTFDTFSDFANEKWTNDGFYWNNTAFTGIVDVGREFKEKLSSIPKRRNALFNEITMDQLQLKKFQDLSDIELEDRSFKVVSAEEDISPINFANVRSISSKQRSALFFSHQLQI